MKYQSEYARSYQNRSPTKFQEISAEERKLNEVPFQRSPSRRRRRRSLPEQTDLNNNYALIGPNDKFADSRLYRLREPVKDNPRVPKSQEYALLGRNEKFQNNVVYPLRKPVVTESPTRVVVRRRKKDNHSCGIQTELSRTKSDGRYRREEDANRSRYAPQSEYRHSYNWEKPSIDQIPNKDSKPREQRSNPPQASTSVGVNTPARVDIDVDKTKQQVKRRASSPKKVSQPKRDETTEYRTSYKPTTIPKKSNVQKAYEAEQIDERKQRKIKQRERAYSDDEGAYENVNLGNEFQQKYPYGKLRRWKSEYQSTYKPFWRYDYKNGKWYKDSATDEKSFNPNLFWYKELLSTRKRAEQYRANAETDHFNPNHTLQLQTGFNINNNIRAWDTDDEDSVISVDPDLERERIEGERRRQKDADRIYPKKEKPSTIRNDQVSQTEHQVDRVIYLDEPPPPKEPSAATKAFVRNLSSSSVQQHMSWDSESLYSQRTNSDQNSHRKYQNTVVQPTSSKKTGTYSPITSDRQSKYASDGYSSPKISDRMIPQKDTNINDNRLPTTYQETSQATGQPSYDANSYEKRPQTSMNQYCTYPANRFKDEVTEYYYRNGDQRQTPVPKPSYSNNKPYNQTYNPRNKDDDVLSVNSARSLSSSCSLASQTLERAQGNMNKYWGDRPPSSPKKPFSSKN